MPGPRLAALSKMAGRTRQLALLAGTALLLAACGGGADSGNTTSNPTNIGTPAAASVEITGLAATGAAIGNATVTAINQSGTRASATTNASGNFNISIDEGAPYLLSITDSSGRSWYSYAPAAGIANLTPLTTLALLQANGNQPLSDLASNWSKRPLSDAQVIDAAKVVNANLASLMQSKSVPATGTNVFSLSFAADGRGLDAVLDALRVTISCSSNACTQRITSPDGNVLVIWNADIATNGISISWSGDNGSGAVDLGIGSCHAPKAGTYSLVVKTSVSGLGNAAVPDLCIDGLPDKPADQTEFCGDATVQQQLPPRVAIVSCTYSGNSGTISAHLGSPFALDYSVTFTFVPR